MKSRILVALLLLAGASACARAQAKTPVATPGLATPEPPERVIVPAPVPEIAEPPPPPVAPVVPRPRDPVSPPRPADRGSPIAAPATPPAEPPPVQLLQTVDKPAEVERQIRAQLSLAQRDLNRVASRPLSVNSRVQYEAARGLIRQADDALKAKDLSLARNLADKAVSLASQLAK